jgi:hypothetical protein
LPLLSPLPPCAAVADSYIPDHQGRFTPQQLQVLVVAFNKLGFSSPAVAAAALQLSQVRRRREGGGRRQAQEGIRGQGPQSDIAAVRLLLPGQTSGRVEPAAAHSWLPGTCGQDPAGASPSMCTRASPTYDQPPLLLLPGAAWAGPGVPRRRGLPGGSGAQGCVRWCATAEEV